MSEHGDIDRTTTESPAPDDGAGRQRLRASFHLGIAIVSVLLTWAATTAAASFADLPSAGALLIGIAVGTCFAAVNLALARRPRLQAAAPERILDAGLLLAHAAFNTVVLLLIAAPLLTYVFAAEIEARQAYDDRARVAVQQYLARNQAALQWYSTRAPAVASAMQQVQAAAETAETTRKQLQAELAGRGDCAVGAAGMGPCAEMIRVQLSRARQTQDAAFASCLKAVSTARAALGPALSEAVVPQPPTSLAELTSAPGGDLWKQVGTLRDITRDGVPYSTAGDTQAAATLSVLPQAALGRCDGSTTVVPSASEVLAGILDTPTLHLDEGLDRDRAIPVRWSCLAVITFLLVVAVVLTANAWMARPAQKRPFGTPSAV